MFVQAALLNSLKRLEGFVAEMSKLLTCWVSSKHSNALLLDNAAIVMVLPFQAVLQQLEASGGLGG